MHYLVYALFGSFGFTKKNNIRLRPFYLSLKSSHCRGIADASAVPPNSPHGEVGGMVRPASSAEDIEEQTFVETVFALIGEGLALRALGLSDSPWIFVGVALVFSLLDRKNNSSLDWGMSVAISGSKKIGSGLHVVFLSLLENKARSSWVIFLFSVGGEQGREVSVVRFGCGSDETSLWS